MQWGRALDFGPLVEPNRDVGSLEKTPQVVGFLLRLRSRFLAEGSEHPDIHAELPRASLIRPRADDTTVQQDDRSKPALILVHLLVVGSVHKVVSTTMALQERVEARKEPHGPAIGRSLFQVPEVLPQKESAATALIHLDKLPAEPVQDDPKSSNVHAGPSPEIGDIGRAEGAQMMPDQRVLGLVFRRHRRRLAKPIIHARERDLRSLARTEAHEAPYHGGPDEVAGGGGAPPPASP